IFTKPEIWYGNLMDGYVSIIAAVLLFGFAFVKGHKLGKIAGITFLVVLVGYFTYRILASCGVVPMLQIPAIFTNFAQ
ncbi:MAG: hypothetical protein K2G26_03785, partial [Clostridia bacterium]|nr:hypothetical protein [Clostridia bacterium]